MWKVLQVMKTNNVAKEKALAAKRSLSYIRDGMTIGLGTGSTAAYMLHGLGEKIAAGFNIKGVPSSEQTAKLARELGIPLATLEESGQLDLTIDGADEFDPDLQLIKGGGGALLREKILAHNSKRNIIIADSGKAVQQLGAFKLPLEVIPFAMQLIMDELKEMELQPVLRQSEGGVFRTDENNFIIDINILGVERLPELNNRLLAIPGIVETGLFLETTDILIMGKGKEVVILERNSKVTQ